MSKRKKKLALIVHCPTPKFVVGGGFSDAKAATVTRNGPYGSHAWKVIVRASKKRTHKLTVYAICVNP